MATVDPILQAVASYYGSSSSIYQKAASAAASAGSLSELTEVMRSIPGVTIDTAASGTWLGWSFDASMAVDSASSAASAINSNIPASIYGSSYAANVPISVADNSGSLVVQGAQKVSSGAAATAITVADRVSLGLIGVNIGCKLGKAIDSALYNVNPSWWDEHYPSINPDTWTSIVGDDGLGGKFFRTLFDIDDAGNTIAYIDEDVLAQTYQLLRDAGVFASSSKEVIVDPSQISDLKGEWGDIKTGNYTYGYYRQNYPNLQSNTTFKLNGDVCIKIFNTRNNNSAIAMFDNSSFTAQQIQTNLATGAITTNTLTSSTIIVSPKPYLQQIYSSISVRNFYQSNDDAKSANISQTYILGDRSDFTLTNTTDETGDLLKILSNATIIDRNPVDGISDISGSTQYPPTNITGTDLDTVKQQLKQEYPDLFANPITESVPQPDGTIKEKTYVPIPWQTTNPTDLTQTSPVTTSNPTTTPTIDPTVAPQIISNPKTVDNPDGGDSSNPPPPSYPDTGTGSVPAPILPTGAASSLWTVYNPTQSDLNSFGAWLWSSDFIDNIIRIFASPMDGVIGLHKVFVTPNRGSSQAISVGYLTSNVVCATVPSQYIDLNCGTIYCQEFFGNVFDYEPYTKVSIYLPFIGVVPLKTSEVMRSYITVIYGVDVYTGACLAKIQIQRDGGRAILYSFGGDCAVHYPLSAGNYSGLISSITGAAMAALGVGVTAMGAPAAAGLGVITAGGRMLSSSRGFNVQHSGGFSGNSGATGPKTPYLIIERPQTNLAQSFEVYDGKGANFTTKVGSCSGYIRCKEVHLHCPHAYRSELEEIERLLKSGVIV